MRTLTAAELQTARQLARTDYEVRHLLAGYTYNTLDDDGFALFLEEIGATP